MTGRRLPCRFLVAILLLTGAPTLAQWSQWGGAARDFKVGADELADGWPEGGPNRLWERPLGPGYTTVLVEGATLYTMYRRGDQEVVIALSARDGKTVWEYAYDAQVDAIHAEDQYLETKYGSGPNSTPMIAGDRIVTLGFTGVVNCLNKADGSVIWSRDLRTGNGAHIPHYGHSASPIRHRDTVIVIANGAIAFKLDDGAMAWSNHEFDGSYASPILVDVDGRTLLVASVKGEIVGVDPGDGSLLWRVEHSNQYGTNLTSPIYGDDDVLFVSAMWIGSRALKLSADGGTPRVEQLWHSKEMQVAHSNTVRIGEWIYGSHGERVQFLAAANVKTGEVAWKERGFARANLIRAGDRFIILDFDAKLALATLTPKGATIHAEAEILEASTWTAPTLDGSTLYVRNQETIVALDLGVDTSRSSTASR